MRQRHTITRATLAVALLVVAAVAGCTRQPEPSPSTSTTRTTSSPTPSPSPTTSLDPGTAEAQAAILTAYQGYWDAKIAAFADPTKDPGPELEMFAVDKAFADVASSVFTFRDNGIKVVGTPQLSPTVSDIVPDASATIVDCVDGTNWQPVYASTGESAAAPGQAHRLVTTSTAYYYVDHWTIRTSVVNREDPC